MQTFVSRKTAEELALQLGTKITIEKVSVTFINRIQISNLYIEDLNGDTLLFAPRINANLRRVNLKKKELTIKKINFYDTYINFVTDSSGVINLKFIIDYMKSSKKIDGSKEKWTYKMMDADFNNSRFHYSRDIIKEVTRGVDFTDMELRNLHISLGNLLVYDDTLSMNIKNLSLKEKSGFILRSFSSNLRLAKDHMHFEKVAFKTPWSVIISPFIHLDFNDYKDFSNIIDLVNIKINLDHSALSFNDISFFAPGLKDYSEEFTLSGLFSGRVSDMKGDNIILHYNVNTLLEANFNLIGLPDFKSTFAYFDIKKFITTTEDLELFEIPGNKKKIELPQNFKSLGKIHYSGKYTGYPDDFVAYGLFKTNLGEFATDLLLKPDTSNTLRFTGKLRTRDFFIGRLLELEEKVDKISMVGNINGYTSKGRFYANIESMVDSFRLFGYNYTNIDVSGTLSESSFNGSFAVSDPNISLSFSGKADFSSENPEYAFTADVERARPYYLNVGTEDPSFFMSFLLKTNFTGRNIDDFNGEISLINSLFSKADKQLQIYDFHLEESNTGTDSSSFVIRSDILDGEVTGIYQFSTLRHSLNKLVKHYIPSFSHAETTVDLSVGFGWRRFFPQ